MALFGKNKENIICPNCNAEISKDSLFCPKCGVKLEIDESGESEEESKSSDKTDFEKIPYIHESDMKSLKALKAIPGFSQLMKKFIKIWNEKEYKIINLSSNLRISESQMPEIYNLLPPICEKLNIDIPEIYMELNVVPNAYTYGDTNPFIVITSGLLETFPKELLPTVIAHECGHIACHHALYTTVAHALINGALFASSYFGLSSFVSFPLQAALYSWERNSELSADRAAAFCDGGSDKVIEMCMRFAGFDKDLNVTVDKELFMQQADDYLEMIESGKWNKTMEFLVLANTTHPFNAVRAKECYEWCQTDDFKELIK